MKHRLLVAGMSLALALVAAVGAGAHQAPPGPTVAINSTFPAASPPARFELIQLVLDFAPGAWTPPHSHGGQGFVTVLAGEMAVRESGAEARYGKGQTWVERPEELAEVGNVGSTTARILVSFLLPEGAPLTVVQQTATENLPPGPTTVYQSRILVLAPPARFDALQLVLDFAPGAWTPSHTHGGLALVTVLDGELTLREKGTARVFKAGETWIEYPGEFAEVGNAGKAPASLAVTFLLPPDTPLTTVQP